MTIEVIPADWSAPHSVRAYTTTRIGGVSEAPFCSLNLGLHVGDDESRVLENRQRLEKALELPSKPRWLKQTHGIIVADLDVADHLDTIIEADGAWTATPGVVIAVLTADCLPVVITNRSGTQIAAVHAGWRGLANGVLDSAVARFSSDEPLHAWLGPAIGPAAFEVGDEVRQVFIDQDSENHRAFINGVAPGKWLANLYLLATMALVKRGNVQVTGGQRCTVSEPGNFHSHRRDGVLSGRMVTLAWLTPSRSA